MSGWRLFKEAKPPAGVPILVGWSAGPWRSQSPGIDFQIYVIHDSGRWYEWTGCYFDPYGLPSLNIDGPTHWMLLPPPPAPTVFKTMSTGTKC